MYTEGRTLVFVVASLSDGCKQGSVDVSVESVGNDVEIRIPSYTVKDTSSPDIQCTAEVHPLTARVPLDYEWLSSGPAVRRVHARVGLTHNTFDVTASGDVITLALRPGGNLLARAPPSMRGVQASEGFRMEIASSGP